MARWGPGAQFQEKNLAGGAPISDNYVNWDIFCNPTNFISFSYLSPDVGNCNLEACFPVQLFYFNQTLRYPEIAVAL